MGNGIVSHLNAPYMGYDQITVKQISDMQRNLVTEQQDIN